MTLQEFSNLLNGIGQEIERTPARLLDEGARIVEEMRRGIVEKNLIKTGALRDSIGCEVVGNRLDITMLDYGQYQNYGVLPAHKDGERAIPVPAFGVEPQPSTPPFYRFKDREWGLKPQEWYDLDRITERVRQVLEDVTISARS